MEVGQVGFVLIIVLLVNLSKEVLWARVSIGKEGRREDIDI